MKDYLITFNRTSEAIQGEAILLEKGLSVKVLPLPSRIRAGCGICFRLLPEEFEEAVRLLEAAGLKHLGLYERDGKNIKEIRA